MSSSFHHLDCPHRLHHLNGGFSLIELLVVITIVGILSTVAYTAYSMFVSDAKNRRVVDDLVAISNSLESYRQDHQGRFPIPKSKGNQNILCFNTDATYAHDCATAAFIQGFIDNNLLTKRYLRDVPLDPRANTRYAYGVSADGKYFMVAGLGETPGGTVAYTSDNLARLNYPLPSLIRAFDGPNFVIDGEKNLPYPSDANALVATLENVNGEVKVDGAVANNGWVVDQGQTVAVTDDNISSADLYFSDGSVTHLDPGADLELKGLAVLQNNKEGTFTKIWLHLTSGKIWSKVARLAEKSEFNIETTSAIAGVRGTEFGIGDGQVIVASGEVDVVKASDYIAAAGFKPLEIGDLVGPLLTPLALSTASLTETSAPVEVTDGITLNYIKVHQKSPLSMGAIPYIGGLIVDPASTPKTLTILVGFGSALAMNDAVDLDGFEVFAQYQFLKKSLVEGQTFLFEAKKTDAAGPSTVPRSIYDANDMAWKIVLPKDDPELLVPKKEDTPEELKGLSFFGPGSPALLTVRAYKCADPGPGIGDCSHKNYSSFAWPAAATNKIKDAGLTAISVDYAPAGAAPMPELAIAAPSIVSLPASGGPAGFTAGVIKPEGIPATINIIPNQSGCHPSDSTVQDTSYSVPVTLPYTVSLKAPQTGACTVRFTARAPGGREMTAISQIEVVKAVEAVTPPAGDNCGNGAIDAGEQCESSLAFTATCPLGTQGTVACTGCRYDYAGCQEDPAYICAQTGGRWVSGTCQKFFVTETVKTFYAVNTTVPLTLENISPTSVTFNPTTASISVNGFTATAPGTYTLYVSGFDPINLKVCGYAGNGTECWVMGTVGQSCTDACSSGLTCKDSTNSGSDWNDIGNNACYALNSGDSPSGSVGGAGAYYAPYYMSTLKRCYSRGTSVTSFDNPSTPPPAIESLCSTYTSLVNYYRICKCE